MGNNTTPHQGATTSKDPNVYMVSLEDVSIQAREKNYNQEKKPKRKE